MNRVLAVRRLLVDLQMNLKSLMFYLFQGLIVDQTIEKVSFCAPDRNHEKGFAYICRDGTTRRWMCHGFLAVKESVSSSPDLFLLQNSLYVVYFSLRG